MKVHETHKLAAEWKLATGKSLREFVEVLPTGDVFPDVDALGKWLSPGEDESISEKLEKEYGKKALVVMEKLFR